MKIYVEKVLDEVVYFSTDYGKAKGIWKGRCNLNILNSA